MTTPAGSYSDGSRQAFNREQARAWSRPPVDDVGYIASAELLAMSDEQLRSVIETMRRTRYTGWRNYQGLWRAIMGLDELRDKDIIDFGCGVGVEALELALGGNRVHLADIVPENIELSQRVLGLYGCKAAGTHRLSLNYPYHWMPNASVDVFYCNGVLHHIPWATEIMEAAHYMLRPAGQARLMVYSDMGWRKATGEWPPPEDTPSHPAFARFVRHFDEVGEYADWYDAAKLTQRFGNLFNVERFEYLCPEKQYLGAMLRRI